MTPDLVFVAEYRKTIKQRKKRYHVKEFSEISVHNHLTGNDDATIFLPDNAVKNKIEFITIHMFVDEKSACEYIKENSGIC